MHEPCPCGSGNWVEMFRGKVYAESPSGWERKHWPVSELIVLTREDDGVIVGRERNFDIPRTVDRVAEAVEVTWPLAGCQPCAAIWDMRGSPRAKPESWQLVIRRVPEIFRALAIIVDEDAKRALGAFPMAIDSLLIPVRMFVDVDEARNWIAPFAKPEPA